jgi:hypothetical protein
MGLELSIWFHVALLILPLAAAFLSFCLWADLLHTTFRHGEVANLYCA